MSLWSLTDKRSTLAASLDTYFYIKDSGQNFEKLVYSDVLIIMENGKIVAQGPFDEVKNHESYLKLIKVDKLNKDNENKES